MLKTLREGFDKIERVNPDSVTLEKMLALFDRLPDAHLAQIADAGIKFASHLAANRLRSRQFIAGGKY